MVIKFKIKTIVIICTFVALAIFAGIGLCVFEFTDPQEPEESVFCIDLADYLMIVYFYDSGESVLIVSPIVGYYDRDANSDIILTEEKTYCIRNWDYKILYSRPELPKNELNKRFEF